MRLLAGLTLLFSTVSLVGFGQVVGGRDNSEMTPQVAEATKLSGGGFVGDVNIMTGEYNASIPLGTVATPSGLSFALELNYNSAFTFGTVQPRTAGIPYGEGWSPNIPTISVETDVFHKFSCSQLSQDGVLSNNLNFADTSDYRGKDEGDVYMFSPMISIPSVGSGKAVFKYVDVQDDNCIVFALNKFEQPIEIRYYGNSWVVKAPDGTRYEFGTHLANYRAPSNQRILNYNQSQLSGLNDNETAAISSKYNNLDEAVQNVIEPKATYSVWYCDKVFNTMYPRQFIHFSYDKFGEFNYYQEFNQSRYEFVRQDVLNTSTNTDFSAYTDIHLREIRSEVMDSDVDILELDYQTMDAFTGTTMLDFDQQGVDRKDSLYSYSVVERWCDGCSGSQGKDFSDWWRYKHTAAVYDPFTGTVSATNPYLEPNMTNGYHREQFDSTDAIGFNHSFLESERITDIMPGDIYEIRTVISREDDEDLDYGNGTIDIAVRTGNKNATAPTANDISSNAFESYYGKEIFSTFNSALKWQMGHKQGKLNTSNFFVMPNISSEHGGFSIQLGPGNSDIWFGAENSFDNPFVTAGTPDVRDIYPYNIQKQFRDVPSTAKIPHNFGTGHPWGMMIPVYNTMALSGTNALDGAVWNPSELYDTWWSNDVGTMPNIPTKFDNSVTLDTLEIIRYSKNPYMLQGVRQYKVNGNYGRYQDTVRGRVLVAHKQLEYTVESPLVLKNNNYSTGDTLKYEINQRHIFLLTSVRELPMDGELYASNYGVTDTAEVLTTFLNYEDIFDDEVSQAGGVYDSLKPYLGQTHYLLNRFTDHLGGITAVQYYPFHKNEGSRFTSNYARGSCSDYVFGMASPEPFGRNKSYSAHAAVRYMAKNDEQDIVKNPLINPFGGSYIHKRWEYIYDTTSYINNPKRLELPQQHFRIDHFTDSDHAFGKVRVYEPALDTLTQRNYTDYEYYGNSDASLSVDEYLYYGKLKSAKTYAYVDGVSDVLHEEKIVNYGHTLAHKNGWTRPNYLREQLGYDDLILRSYEYKDIYRNDELTTDYFSLSITDTTFYYDTIAGDTITTFVMDTTWTYSATGADAKLASAPNYISGRYTDKERPKLLEFYFYDTLLAQNHDFMLHSYFVKKTSEINRTYDKLASKSSISGTNPPITSPNLDNNPGGGGVVNPKPYDPVTEPNLMSKITSTGDGFVGTLIDSSPLSDTVLIHMLNSAMSTDVQANVLAYQGGLSNKVWEVLIDSMETFAPKRLESIIHMQPYFSDTTQKYLIEAVGWTSDTDVFVKAMTKNSYLTDDVVIALTETAQLPGQSFGDILEAQPQRSEEVLDSIIVSDHLSTSNINRILTYQYMSDARFDQLIDEIDNHESSMEDRVTTLFEETISYPSDSVLISVAERPFSSRNAEKIMDAAERNLSQGVLDAIDANYSLRQALTIKPKPVVSNPLSAYCNNPVDITRNYIETKTEYDYYEADWQGRSVGKAHDILLGHRSSVDDPSPFPITLTVSNLGGAGAYNPGFVIDSLRLKHEPSWQVFSIKTSSPQQPDAYTRDEFFYLYDLQNRYDRYWYNYDLDSITGLSADIHCTGGGTICDTLVARDSWDNEYNHLIAYPKPRPHDGMEKTRTHGNKVLAFQKTTFSKNSRDLEPVMTSEYYQYDSRWLYDDLPTTRVIVEFDGEPCANLPAADTLTTIEDCEDCEEIFFKPFMDPEDVTPTYHCLWHVPGAGYFICDSDIDWTSIDTTATEIYCDPGLEDTVNQKAITYGMALSKALYLRNVTLQVDSLDHSTAKDFSKKRIDHKNDYIAEFSTLGPGDEDTLGFASAHAMIPPYDHLAVRTIHERNRYGQPELEGNQIGLLTRYEYNKSERRSNRNENCTTDTWSSTYNVDIGLPTRIVVGVGKADSMNTYYQYTDAGLVEKVTAPSGKAMEYSFDTYHRLIKITELTKERVLSDIEYNNWAHNDTVSFDGRTDENWVLTTLYNSDLESDSLDYEYRKAFLDPLGRNNSVVSAYWQNPSNLRQIHSGSVEYDNWGRTEKAYKNFIVDQTLIKYDTNYSRPFAATQYENDPKARALRASNYGVDVWTNPVVKTDYCLTNDVFASCELELSNYELPLIMSSGTTSAFRFYRNEVKDQDDKTSVEYLNAVGQKIGTIKYNNQNQKIITLFVYDSYGNVTKVINPIKQENDFVYNMLGQLVKETSVDAGTKRYMYNKQGLVAVEQDENARTHTENGSASPFYRVYQYDDYGRVTKVGRKENGFGYSNDHIYDPLYYATVFIDDALVNANYEDTGHYFDYTFTNASSQDWLTSFEVWDSIPSYPDYGNVEVSGFDTQFAPTVLEKEFVYGGNSLNNTIGQIVQSFSYDDKGVKVQGSYFAYDSLDRMASQRILFDPYGIDDTTGNIVSIIEYPDYNYRQSLLEQRVDVNGDSTVDFHCFMQYDRLNRLSSIRAAAGKVDSLDLATLLVSYAYDDTNGLVIRKEHFIDENVSGSIVNQLVNEIEHRFDVRDRLTQTKVGQLTNGLSPLMNYRLYYDGQAPSYTDTNYYIQTVNFNNNYNGNINGTLMQYAFDGNDVMTNVSIFDKPTLYGYTYDNVNRMTNADATVGDYLVASGSPDYSASYQIGDVDLQYDRIGNINSLDRTSRNAGGGTYTTLQSFNYNYGLGTNRLNAATGLGGTTTRNYTYDANGNMLTDDYRNIDSTHYSRAAYPFYINLDGDDVNYLYSVDDQRIYTKESNGSDSTKTYYLMDAMGKTVAIYTMDTVGNNWEYYIASAERECRLTPRVLQVPGTNELTTDPTRLTFEKGQASFYYYDHLGNTRLVCMPDSFAVDTTVQEILFVADYFPFGKMLREYSSTYEERFLTTQHERDRNTGLDYRGARYYDADVARFLSLDPLARQYPSLSDYSYVAGNPIIFIDPTGMAVEDIGIYTVDNKGNVKHVRTIEHEDEYDMLYKKEDWDNKEYEGNRVRIDDLGLLTELSNGNLARSSAASENKEEFTELLLYLMNNTDVEWGGFGYRQGDGKILNVMATSHQTNTVGGSTSLDTKYGEDNLVYDIHSHPGYNGTKGASVDDEFADDMDRIRSRYNRLGKTMSGGFPRHYVYHKSSNNLYKYTPWESDIFLRTINSYKDLRRIL